MGDVDAAANLIPKAAAYLNGRRPVEYWEEAVAAELKTARSTLDARVKELEGLLRRIQWKSADRDNMEFSARITCFLMDEIAAALAEKEPANG